MIVSKRQPIEQVIAVEASGSRPKGKRPEPASGHKSKRLETIRASGPNNRRSKRLRQPTATRGASGSEGIKKGERLE